MRGDDATESPPSGKAINDFAIDFSGHAFFFTETAFFETFG
jgi:hypothetical protein